MWDSMHIAFDLSFMHTDGRWRQPGSWAGYGYYPEVEAYIDVARAAERGCIDMLFFGDGTGIPNTWEGNRDAAVRWGVQWPRHDKSPLVAILSQVTEHLGFTVTFASTFMHPYYVARLMNSLDHLTKGRVGLNLITSTRSSDAANYGFSELMEHGRRYEKMEEFVAVCEGLWDSVEADAILLDRETGQFADPSKVHVLDHHGEFFDVAGPLNCMPSPQGRPVLIQAGASPRGIAASARFADVVFAEGGNAESMKRHRAALDGALVDCGRSPDDVGILWGTPIIVGESASAIRERQQSIIESLPLEAGGVYLSHNSGFDFSTLPAKFTLGDVQEAIESNQGSQSFVIHRLIDEHGAEKVMTLEDLLDVGRHHMVAMNSGIVGTPAEVVDQLEELHEIGGSRGGFMLCEAELMPRTLVDFVDFVVPELQRRGLFRTEYRSTTLREQLRE